MALSTVNTVIYKFSSNQFENLWSKNKLTRSAPRPPSLATTGIRRVKMDEPNEAIPQVNLNPILEDR